MSESARDVANPRTRGDRRICVLVAGMHRSGTSALTRILNLLGCDLAQPLVPPDQFNERGYWEAPEIVELNDAILKAAGSSWDDWRPLEPRWLDERPEFDEWARALLERFFHDSRQFLLKDPRFCRLLPFWRDALHNFGTDVGVVLPVRLPVEVAASLLKRNGMNASIAQLVWLRHVLDAEAASRDLPRVVVCYDEVTRYWQSVADHIAERLGLDLLADRQVEREVNKFLSPHLHHHRAGEAESLIYASPISGPWFSNTWASLKSGADAPEVRAQLDEVRREFDRATLTFGCPIAELGAHGRYLKECLDAAEEKAARQSNMLEEARAKAAQQSNMLEEARAKAGAMHTLFTEISRSLVQRNDELESIRVQLEAIERSCIWRLARTYRRLGGSLGRRLRALAPTPLGQRIIRWRNRVRILIQ